MRTQREFFYAVLSGTGKPCLAWKPANQDYFSHKVFDSVDEFCEALSGVDYSSADYYFCISTLAEKSIRVGDRTRVRTHTNCAFTRAFILDIDIKEGSDAFYASKDEAYEGLDRLRAAMMLPAPIVVDSGYGLHVYWYLVEGVKSDDWTRAAKSFKSAVQVLEPKLVGDGTRVADSASVLRIPESFNLKYGKQAPVLITQWQEEPVDLARIVGALPPKLNSPTTATLAPTSIESAPVPLTSLAKNCNWFAGYVKNKSQASEPEWYAALGLAKFIEHNGRSGEAVAQALSKGHPEYSEAATAAKYLQVVNGQTGPSTCERLKFIAPERCNGCPFAGAVVTPITAARLSRPAVEEKTVVTTVILETGDRVQEEVVIPVPPKPYFRGEDGGVFARVKVKEDDGSFSEHIEKIYDYDFYPLTRYRTEAIESEATECKLWLPHDGVRTFRLPSGLLADSKNISKFLAEKGVIPEPGKMPKLVNYMVNYVRTLQQQRAAEVEFSRFGWRDINSANPKFVVGNGFLDVAGDLNKSTYAPFLKDAAKAVGCVGSLEEWKRGFSVYTKIPDSEPYHLALMMGFAAPLMALTEYAGVMYNMVGESAAGKSTAMRFMASVWGQPIETHVLHKDTEISIHNFIGYLSNVPVAFDELTHMEADKLANFVLSFTGGRGKMRASRDGQNKDNNVEWDTIVVASSNVSVYDKLAQNRRGYSAEAMRVFEVKVPPSVSIYKPAIDEAIQLVKNNYGLAGREFIKYVLPRLAEIKKAVEAATAYIFKRGKLRNEERFWAAMFACAYVGGKIAKDKLGLHDYSMEGLLTWALGSNEVAREKIQQSVTDPASILADYFNSNLTAIVRISDGYVDLAGDASKLTSIRGRIECVGGVPAHGYIPVTAIRDYCKSKNIDVSWLKNELQAARIVTQANFTRRLASGTKLPNIATRCWCIDMKHPTLEGLIEDQVHEPDSNLET